MHYRGFTYKPSNYAPFMSPQMQNEECERFMAMVDFNLQCEGERELNNIGFVAHSHDQVESIYEKLTSFLSAKSDSEYPSALDKIKYKDVVLVGIKFLHEKRDNFNPNMRNIKGVSGYYSNSKYGFIPIKIVNLPPPKED